MISIEVLRPIERGFFAIRNSRANLSGINSYKSDSQRVRYSGSYSAEEIMAHRVCLGKVGDGVIEIIESARDAQTKSWGPQSRLIMSFGFQLSIVFLKSIFWLTA